MLQLNERKIVFFVEFSEDSSICSVHTLYERRYLSLSVSLSLSFLFFDSLHFHAADRLVSIYISCESFLTTFLSSSIKVSSIFSYPVTMIVVALYFSLFSFLSFSLSRRISPSPSHSFISRALPAIALNTPQSGLITSAYFKTKEKDAPTTRGSN